MTITADPPVPAGPALALAQMEAITAAMVTLTNLVRDAAGWSGEERRGMLGGLDRVVDGLVAVRGVVLVAERESGTWQGAGDRSFEAWRGRTGRTGPRVAAAQVRQATHLDAVPSAAAAVAAGRIGLEHAAILGRVAATGTPAQQDAVQSAAGQEHLLGLATQLDAATFATAVAGWAATVDPAGLERDHQAQRRARYLHVTHTPGGTLIKGQLDTIAGHRLTLALEALTPRPGAADDRDPGQRRADALDTMATRILASTDTKPGGHVPPQITIILSEETWVAARAERDRQRRTQAAGDRPDTDETTTGEATTGQATGAATTEPAHRTGPATPRDPAGVAAPQTPDGTGTGPGAGYPPATLEDGTPVPASEVAVAMCDCEIMRLVIDADGAPLDLGRSQRLFTGSQRRAVIARDRHCTWPHCHMPARWCDIHHLRWWNRDTGPTSVDNGALLCSYHHHEVHTRDLTITRLPLTSGDSPPPRRGLLPPAGSPPPPEGPPRTATPPAARTPREAGTPPRGRLRSTVARVAYEFRDHAGRAVSDAAAPAKAEAPGSATGAMRPTAGQSRNSAATDTRRQTPNGPRPTSPRTPADSRPTSRPAAPPPPPSSGQAEHTPHDELDLTWTTDPVTGARVPAFFLSG